MKKLLIGLAALLLIGFGALQVAQTVIMDGDSYYVQITTDGEKTTSKDDNGNVYTQYHYELPGYDENGKSKTLDFNGFQERPLRKEAYLKLTWNEKKGVTGYEEVKEKDIPTKALTQLKGA